MEALQGRVCEAQEADGRTVNSLARQILRVARDILWDAEYVFLGSGEDSDDRMFNRLSHDLSEVADKLARKHRVEFRIGTSFSGRAMEWSIGVDGEGEEAMLQDIARATKSLGRKYDVRVL